jgi:hypothetical protein
MPQTRMPAEVHLADGRSVGLALDYVDEAPHWVCCRVEITAATGPIDVPRARLLEDPADIPVYGTSLTLLLHAVLDSGGDIAHLETGRLSQLDAGVLRKREGARRR